MGQKTEMTIMKNSRCQYLQKTTKEIKTSNKRQKSEKLTKCSGIDRKETTYE